MDNINCLIIDDEELARNLVENYVNRIPHLTVCGKFANPIEAMQVLNTQRIDLVFLDIQMPELSGVDFLKMLAHKPAVIFTTAYGDYALEGYDLGVVDYLVKPFRFERFLQAVDKAGLVVNRGMGSTGDLKNTSEPTVEERSYLVIKADYKTYRIGFDDIIFIEGMKEYVALHMEGERKLTLTSLKKLGQTLPDSQFIRIHKSYIVNVKYIKAMEGNMLHVADKKLPIGGSYKNALIEKYF